MLQGRSGDSSWSRARSIAVLLVLLFAPLALGAQPVRPIQDRPDLSVGREVVLSGIGAGMAIAGLLVPVHEKPVPTAGLDPSGIGWNVDRDIIGNADSGAHRVSGWTRNAALVFPVVLAVATSGGEDRWQDLTTRGVVYAEAMLISQGSTLLGKALTERARPYAYVAEGERPSDSAFDVSTERTFQSMPSGHSSSAWTGAALGVTEHLLTRPTAHWAERLAVGFTGGALAGATSALRVEAGQHFPSDVVAGAGIGIATGIAIPMLHRGNSALPSWAAVLQTLSGVVGGTVFGAVLAR